MIKIKIPLREKFISITPFSFQHKAETVKYAVHRLFLTLDESTFKEITGENRLKTRNVRGM